MEEEDDLYKFRARTYRFIPEDHDNFTFCPPPEAPVFEPTNEEFENPLAYIDSIKRIGEKFGIIKIRPPPEWQPPFAIDMNTFKFKARVQKLSQLEARNRMKLNFHSKIMHFWQRQGYRILQTRNRKARLDLYLLHHAVIMEGGFYKVNRDFKWVKVAKRMNVTPLIAHIIAKFYEEFFYPFLLYEENKLKGLAERKRVKKVHKAQSLHKKMSNTVNPTSLVVSQNSITSCSSASYQATNENKIKNVEMEVERRTDKSNINPEVDPPMNENEIKKVEVEVERRTDKSNINPEVDPLAKYVCKFCSEGDDEECILLCDGCNDSYHSFCLKPPLLEVPKGDWKCPICVEKDIKKPIELFSLAAPETEYSLMDFWDKADKFKTSYFDQFFGRHSNYDYISEDIVESVYWWILSDSLSKVVVGYGAALNSLDHNGSGFPSEHNANTVHDPEFQKYLKSPWNLNNLPTLNESLLSFISEEIPSMNVPRMYVGMCFSTFCWHTEDHWTYSINYLHWGGAKTWYGVPGYKAAEFEKVMQLAAPELFEKQPDLLHKQKTILNPSILLTEGVPVFRTDQQAGEFVVTFPRVYHAGFNQGFNFAESVNFAPFDWLPAGRECINHYSSLRRYNVFSQDELIVKIAGMSEHIDKVTAAAAYNDFVDMINDESRGRSELSKWGLELAEKFIFEFLPADERLCFYCNTTLYLSGVICKCDVKKVSCLRHYKDLCNCPPSQRILRYRWNMIDLSEKAMDLKERVLSYREVPNSDSDSSNDSYSESWLSGNGILKLPYSNPIFYFSLYVLFKFNAHLQSMPLKSDYLTVVLHLNNIVPHQVRCTA